MKPEQDSQNILNKTFRLFDAAIFFAVIGLLYFTYEAIVDSRPLESRLIFTINLAAVWFLFLFKIHLVSIPDRNTVIFKGIFRKIKVSPQDIVSFQDLLRGVRIVLKNKSIILWPFIARQGEFKILLRNLNQEIEFVDVADMATKTPSRIVLLLLGMFTYFAVLTGALFYHFTHNIN